MTTKARKHGAGRRKTTARAARERRLATLAGRQYGVVGRWQLVELGRGRRRARAGLKPFLLAEQRYVEDTASPLEDRFAEFVVAHRLPPPQTNVLVDGDCRDARSWS